MTLSATPTIWLPPYSLDKGLKNIQNQQQPLSALQNPRTGSQKAGVMVLTQARFTSYLTLQEFSTVGLDNPRQFRGSLTYLQVQCFLGLLCSERKVLKFLCRNQQPQFRVTCGVFGASR